MYVAEKWYEAKTFILLFIIFGVAILLKRQKFSFGQGEGLLSLSLGSVSASRADGCGQSTPCIPASASLAAASPSIPPVRTCGVIILLIHSCLGLASLGMLHPMPLPWRITLQIHLGLCHS